MMGVPSTVILLFAVCTAAAPEDQPISCGPAAVSLAARLVDRSCSPAELRDAFQGRLQGEHLLQDLWNAALRLGLATRAASVGADCAVAGGVPLVVPVRTVPNATETNHFVVLYGRTARGVQVLDPPRAPRFVSPRELACVWDGTGFYVAATPVDLAGLPASRQVRAWLSLGGGGLLLTLSLAALVWSARQWRPRPVPGGSGRSGDTIQS